MSDTYGHGVYTGEQATSLLPPVRVEVSMPVMVGVAPVHMLPEAVPFPVNKPVLIFSPEEITAKLGSLPPGASLDDYPLLDALQIYVTRYGCAPVVAINVFDPTRHVDGETPDPSKVTVDDILGGIDAATGERAGLELVSSIYPKFGIIPGQILCPGFSDDPTVALTIGAKTTGISGHFKCVGIADFPKSVTSYTLASEYVMDNNLSDPNLVMFFGNPVYNNRAEIGSVHWAGITGQRDAENWNIPYWSPSNKRLLANGMSCNGRELVLDSSQAAYLNGQGIVTGLSWAGSLVGWGNRTAAYPGVTDVKDTFIPIRRMFNFAGNTLVTTAWQMVDRPLDRRQAGTVCNTFNVWLNGLARRGFILGGRVLFLASENPDTDLMDGISRFHVFFTPPSPNREMDFILEYDPSYLSTLFAA